MDSISSNPSPAVIRQLERPTRSEFGDSRAGGERRCDVSLRARSTESKVGVISRDGQDDGAGDVVLGCQQDGVADCVRRTLVIARPLRPSKEPERQIWTSVRRCT